MIARTRKRPRVKTCSFRTFWWLLSREAAWRILWADVSADQPSRLRVRFTGLDSRYITRQVTGMLRHAPTRRFYP